METEKLKMAVCGLNCNECNIFKASYDIAAADAILNWFKQQGWININESTEEFMKKGPLCCGCRGDRLKHWSSDYSIQYLHVVSMKKNLIIAANAEVFPVIA
jgi:hypothetical protein